MNCIIVDDDIFSTRIMSDFIKRTSILNLVKTFDNAIDAIEFIAYAGNKIQIIFLDIEMPEMSGIDFMKSIDVNESQVIIYSSQQKYALESYEYNVADYLLKPVTYTRFIKAVQRVKADLDSRKGESKIENEATDDDDQMAMFKDSNGEMCRVRFADIFYIESNENYVLIVTGKQRLMVHSTLTKLLEVIPQTYVMRVHRSYAIGVKYITGADLSNIKLTCGNDVKTVPMGKTYRPELRKLLISYCIL